MQEDPSLRELSRLEVLNKIITSESCYSFQFLNRIVFESLRFSPPLGASAPFVALEDIKLGDFNVKKGDKLGLWMYNLHRNPSQWQSPHEFLPERFDPDDPLFLTPSGKKRHPFSFSPFNGGSRVCLGKTQAELNIRTFIIFLSQILDFEFAEPEKYEESYPNFSIYLSK